VVQKDAFNDSAISTVVVVIITRNLRLADAPGNVMLPQRSTCLPHDSVANISQIVTIDKHFLTDCVSILPHNLFEKVKAGLNLIL